ncbi:MAG: Cytochrome c-type biogenesis protein CcmH [Legionellaceae bacterium]
MLRIFLIFCLCFWILLTDAVSTTNTLTFSHPQQAERYQALILELRCLVCQNQTIADSNAPLAKDLRQEVATLIQRNYSDEAIKQYLIQRYGQFILYKPLLTKETELLWFGPFLLLAIAFTVLILIIRQRRRYFLTREKL